MGMVGGAKGASPKAAPERSSLGLKLPSFRVVPAHGDVCEAFGSDKGLKTAQLKLGVSVCKNL